ncbi:MAG TPA: ATP-binding protein [Acidisarcina sp.]
MKTDKSLSVEQRKEQRVELRLPSKLGFEKIAMQTAASYAAILGLAPDRVEDLKTAVAEACINAIEHGNHGDEKVVVGVILTIDHRRLEVKVLDHGSGITHAVLPPDIDKKMLGEEDPRGMGMFLIEALVDEVEWVSNPPEGSYARLVIYLDREKR